MVGCVRKLNHLNYSPRTVFSRNYSTYDPAAMNEDFKNANWCSIYMSTNVNTAVKLFNEIVKGIFYRQAPEAARRVGETVSMAECRFKKAGSYVTKSTQYQRGKSLVLI